MEDEIKSFEWTDSSGSIPEIYTNYVHLSWTLDDVRILFGILKPKGGGNKEFSSEARGAVTMSWRQAKALSEMLANVVNKYEEKNGAISPAKLADRP
jgi:hypothetical protein